VTPSSSIPIESNGLEFDSTVITVLPALIPPEKPTPIEPEGRLYYCKMFNNFASFFKKKNLRKN
jgi:hypothetical protein